MLSKGLRATQLYLPNNPVYQRAVDNIRAALRQIWQATDDLVFDVAETEVRWEDAVVYSQDNRSESIAWTLYKDGVRSLAFKPGIEDVEIVRFLGVMQQAKNLQADAQMRAAIAQIADLAAATPDGSPNQYRRVSGVRARK